MIVIAVVVALIVLLVCGALVHQRAGLRALKMPWDNRKSISKTDVKITICNAMLDLPAGLPPSVTLPPQLAHLPVPEAVPAEDVGMPTPITAPSLHCSGSSDGAESGVHTHTAAPEEASTTSSLETKEAADDRASITEGAGQRFSAILGEASAEDESVSVECVAVAARAASFTQHTAAPLQGEVEAIFI